MKKYENMYSHWLKRNSMSHLYNRWISWQPMITKGGGVSIGRKNLGGIRLHQLQEFKLILHCIPRQSIEDYHMQIY